MAKKAQKETKTASKTQEEAKPAQKTQKFELDTSDLKPICAPSECRGEDSFAAEFYRAVERESEHVLARWKDVEYHNLISVKTPHGGRAAPADVANAVSNLFIEITEGVCQHMHKYLLEHDGRVTRWADPAAVGSFRLGGENYEFRYDYFGRVYEEKNGAVTRPAGRSYHNFYTYYADRSESAVKKLEDAFDEEHDRAHFLDGENAALKTADEALEKAKNRDEAVLNARAGLLLVLLLAVLVGLITLRGLGYPVDLEPAANALTGFLRKTWNTLPSVLNVIVCVPLAIPIYVCVIPMALVQSTGDFILSMAEFGMAWHIGPIVLLWGAVAVVAVLLQIHRAFWQYEEPAAQRAYDEAKKALHRKQKEYKRMQDEFRQSERYKEAQQKDAQQEEARLADKAANEAFAEQWQRAWFEAVQ